MICGKDVSPMALGNHYGKLLSDDIVGISKWSLPPGVTDFRWSSPTFAKPGTALNMEDLQHGIDIINRQSKRKEKKMEEQYTVGIDQAENGFIVKVGCRTFVFREWSQASMAIGEYFDDPKAAQEKYCRKGKTE